MARLRILCVVVALFTALIGLPAGAGGTVANRSLTDPAAQFQARPQVHPHVLQKMREAPASDIQLLVRVRAGTDLRPYMRDVVVRPYVDPLGLQGVLGTVEASRVPKVAGVAGVVYIQLAESLAERPRIDAPGVELSPEAIRRRVEQVRAGGGTREIGPRSPSGWFDVLDTHKSRLAWAKGFSGEGVNVMVNDTGIDFAHPDLYGTQARVQDASSPYHGWPQQYDSFSMTLWANDIYAGTDFTAQGVGDYVDTSQTCGPNRCRFQPMGADGEHPYTLPGTSKSGVYHIGSHTDFTLEAFWFGERPAVLVVDEHTAGVYDTVYVDLDDDYDFTNDKPLRKGDEISGLDFTGDGYSDLSGGMIYFIADGVNPIPAADWLWGLGEAGDGEHDEGEPENGSLVAFIVDDVAEGGSHGTLCASAVAGQGVVDGAAPPYKYEYRGPGDGVVVGGGRDVSLMANGNFYTSFFIEDALLFSSIGYDGVPGTGDETQIVSNSWGFSASNNDGWDFESRLFDAIILALGPEMSVLKSTGNGGPGYGTTAPPSGSLMVSVGASTQMGSSGSGPPGPGAGFDPWDSITSADQITFGDVIPFSNRGPSARGEVGPDVVADGAFASGDYPLNGWGDGWTSWIVWGGTSRSTPVAAGNLALVYDAYHQRNGTWPATETARAILKSGATDINYDPFVQGSGMVNADRATDNAFGGGFYASPDSWQAGSFRGQDIPAFAKVIGQGGSDSQRFRLVNPGRAAQRVRLSDSYLVRTGEETFPLTTAGIRSEDPYDFNRPNYLMDLTDRIPAGTDLMVVRAVYPYDEFDPDGDYSLDNNWRLVAYDWTDGNGNGRLWNDGNGNGTVNASAGELDLGEFMRFTYDNSDMTSKAVFVQDPHGRMHDGVFLGLQHSLQSSEVFRTHFTVRVEYYRHADWPWLTVSNRFVTIPAGGYASFGASVRVPSDATLGAYEAAIAVDDGTHHTLIPVSVNVAARGSDFAFGGGARSQTLYDNGSVFGNGDWGWRPETGDWRFFFAQLPAGSADDGTLNALLVDTEWETTPTDIDTLVMAPTPDEFSTDLPGFFGPYTLQEVGGSVNTNIGAGTWLFRTATGGPRELVAAPYHGGLNLVALHTVNYSGAGISERVRGRTGRLSLSPAPIELRPTGDQSVEVELTSSLPLTGLVAEGYGLSKPETFEDQVVHQDDPNDISTASYTREISITHAATMDVSIEGEGGTDIDLILYHDADGDGEYESSEIVAGSFTGTAIESVSLVTPPDGDYLIAVHGWAVPGGTTTFDLTIDLVAGNDITVTGLPDGEIEPGTTYTFEVSVDTAGKEAGTYSGLLLLGPPEAPTAIQVPITATVD